MRKQKSGRKVADLRSKHPSPATGSQLFPFKRGDVGPRPSSPSWSPGLRADCRSWAWLGRFGSESPAHLEAECWWLSNSAGRAHRPSGGESGGDPHPRHPQMWPRLSCLHWGSSPLNTLEDSCQLASFFPGDTFSAFPVMGAKKSRPTHPYPRSPTPTSSHLAAPQCPG